MGKPTEKTDYDSLPVILNAYDLDFSKGKIGIYIDGSDSACFEDISIEVLLCKAKPKKILITKNKEEKINNIIDK